MCFHYLDVISNLDPTLSEEDTQDLVKTSLASVLSCQPDDEEQNLLLMEKTLMALSDLLKELLIKNMTVKTFNILLQACTLFYLPVLFPAQFFRSYSALGQIPESELLGIV